MERRHFDDELQALKQLLIRMSALAETMIAEAIRALMDKNRDAISRVYTMEEQVNALQVEIDEKCLTLIALHQPAAGDLRFILGAVKTNTDLERLADQAVNVCNKAERLLAEPPLGEWVVIPRMASLARAMLKDSLHAYVNRDVSLARDVLSRDDALDALKAEITREMEDLMARDARRLRYAMDIILIARNLERIGDHATNIAENIIFVVEGRDVRHHKGTTPA